MKSALTYERISRGEIHEALGDADRELLDRWKAEDQEFLSRFPEAPVLALPKRTRLNQWFLGAGSLAAVLLAAVWISPLVLTTDASNTIKGAIGALRAFENTASGARPLVEGETLAAGDEIQLAYSLAKKLNVLIVSVDGRGGLTQHFPLGSETSVTVEAHAMQLLPYSYRLDNAPRFEDVFLIVCSSPFSLSDIKPSLVAYRESTATSVLALPARFTVTRLHIAKKVSP